MKFMITMHGWQMDHPILKRGAVAVLLFSLQFIFSLSVYFLRHGMLLSVMVKSKDTLGMLSFATEEKLIFGIFKYLYKTFFYPRVRPETGNFLHCPG